MVGTGTTADAPALSLTPRYDATDMVRGPGGQLFLVDAGAQLISYSADQLSKSGVNQELTPERTVTVDAPGALALSRVAVDRHGNVYLSATTNRVLKLAGASLAKTGAFSVAPAMTLRSRTSDPGAELQAIVVH